MLEFLSYCVTRHLHDDKETSKYTFLRGKYVKIRKNTIRFEADASSSVAKGNCLSVADRQFSSCFTLFRLFT